MNLCFKSVFNRRTGTWQVTSEKTRSAGKTGSSVRKPLLAMMLGLCASGAMAQTIIDNGTTQTINTPVADFHFFVGSTGLGTLNIANGGSLTSSYATVGSETSSNGTLNVVGNNASWTNSELMYLGLFGTGALNIQDGAKVISGEIAVGQYAGSSGSIRVAGAGSYLDMSGGTFTRLVLGNVGTGTLEITQGGKVTGRRVFAGFDTGGSGSIKVTGAGSLLETMSEIVVGMYAEGSLNIENGGKVTSPYAIVGLNGTGSVTVTGKDSQWINSGPMTIGLGNNATLNINNGGKVVSPSVVLASEWGSTTVNLDGTSGARGIISTGYLSKGYAFSLSFNWNGGILQATNNQSDFFYNFASSDIAIGNEGAYFDTNGFNVRIPTAGILNGTGGLTKLGAGELTVAGGNSYAGNTTVSAGTLTLDTYTQSANQTLGIGATSAGVNGYGKLNVTGVASFNDDANLAVDVATVNTLAKDQTLSGIVRAGTLNATTFKVTDNSALFNFRAVTNLDTVDLVVEAVSAGVRNATSQYGYSSASGAATVLDTQINNGATGDMGTVVAALGQLTDNRDVARATAQTLPVISGNQAIQGALSTFQNLVQQRNGIIGTSGMSSGDELSNKNGWGKVFGSRADQNDRSGAAGFKADTWGLAFGADAEVSPGARFGVAYGYAKTSVNGNTDLSGTTQRANIDSHVVSAYGSKDIGGNRTFSFQADIGMNDNKATRQIDFGGLNRTARADYRTYSAHVGAAIAQAFALSEKTTLTPALRADYTWLKSESYNETGANALNLSVGSNKTDAFVLGADAYLQHRFSPSSRIDTNFGLGYDTINQQGSIVATYAGAPGQAFVTTGIDHSPWLVRGGIGYTMTSASGTEINFRYGAEGRSDYLNHTASVRAKWVF